MLTISAKNETPREYRWHQDAIEERRWAVQAAADGAELG